MHQSVKMLLLFELIFNVNKSSVCMKKRVMLILSCLFLSIGFITAQTTSISGTVMDEAGEPVVGASVVVKGTTIGVSTDIDGKFTIGMPQSGAMLEFSIIGMETVSVKASNGMRVVLRSKENVFDDVVVVGYGTGRKVGTTVGTVSRVTSDKIELKPVANAMDALQGKVAGMQSFTSSGEPGSTSSVIIRGIGSLTAGTAPLYILDGAQVGSDAMLTVNSSDIENVSILKDASATSIYGARAANGVIVITTKRGRVGQKASVTASYIYGISQLARSVGNPMNARELADFQLQYGYISQARHDDIIASGVDTDWEKYYFRNDAPMHQANLSIRGGGGRTIYYVSAGLLDQDGPSINSNYKKYNFRANIEDQATQWMRFGVNVGGFYDETQTSGYTYQGSNSLQGGIYGTLLRQPYYNPYNEDGSKKDFIPELNAWSPDYLLSVQPRKVNNAQVNGSAFIQLNPVEGLTLRSQASIEAYDYRRTNSVLPSNLVGWTSSTTERFSRNARLMMTNTAEYKFDINKEHNIILLAGQEGLKNNYDIFTAQTTGQSDDRMMLLSAGTTATLLTGSDNIYKSEYSYSSFFGRLDYNYNEKYYADFSVRRDGSSRFGTNHKYATFFSGGVMWDILKEDFMAEVKPLTTLRLKGSIGSTGNSEIGNYNHLALMGISNYGGQTGWVLTSAGNPDLKWEKITQLNVTAEIALYNKLNLELTYYNKKTDDMLMNVPLPYTSGFSTLTKNVGAMTNRGFEATVNWDIYSNKDWRVGLAATYGYNKNKIDALFDDFDEWPMLSYMLCYKVGHSANEFYMAKYAGVDPADGKPMWWVPGTNETTKDYDEEKLAQLTGKDRYGPHSGGLNLNVSYKGIYLTADFAYVIGKYMVNNDRYNSENPGGAGKNSLVNQSRDIIGNVWGKPGDTGKMYSSYLPVQFDDHLLENASFLRMKNLTVGYQFPKNILRKTKVLENARIFGTARNLFTITKYKGADPEINSNLTYGAYPNTRQFTIGVELTF